MDIGEVLDKTALILSRIFHPLIISVPLGVLVLLLADLSVLESVKWVLLSATVTILPTSAFLNYHPQYHLRDVNSRENRNLLYLIGIAELGLLMSILWALKAPQIVMILSYSIILLTLIDGLINRFTKISLHVSILSGFSSAASFLSPETGVLSFATTAGVAWSRVRLGRHTTKQVALGLTIPAFCIFLVFNGLV